MPAIHRLAEVLESKGWSKRRLAKAEGVAYESVFRYFRDGYDPKLSKLLRWSEILGVEVSELIAKKKRRPSKR